MVFFAFFLANRTHAQTAAAKYKQLYAQRTKEQKEARASSIAKRRSSRKATNA